METTLPKVFWKNLKAIDPLKVQHVGKGERVVCVEGTRAGEIGVIIWVGVQEMKLSVLFLKDREKTSHCEPAHFARLTGPKGTIARGSI